MSVIRIPATYTEIIGNPNIDLSFAIPPGNWTSAEFGITATGSESSFYIYDHRHALGETYKIYEQYGTSVTYGSEITLDATTDCVTDINAAAGGMLSAFGYFGSGDEAYTSKLISLYLILTGETVAPTSAPCTLAVSLAFSDAMDNGNGTFSVTWTATATGGTAPYAYRWAFTPPDAIDPAVLNCPQGQTTQTVTLTLPFAPYVGAGLAPQSGQTPPVWLTASCTVTDADFAAPPSLTFTANALTAGTGNSVGLTWSAAGATSVTLDGVPVSLSGSQNFVPFP